MGECGRDTTAYEELNLTLLVDLAHHVHHESTLGTRVIIVKAGLGDGVLTDDILPLALLFVLIKCQNIQHMDFH